MVHRCETVGLVATYMATSECSISGEPKGMGAPNSQPVAMDSPGESIV